MTPTVGDVLFLPMSVDRGIRTLVPQNVADFAPFDEIETMTVTVVSIGG